MRRVRLGVNLFVRGRLPGQLGNAAVVGICPSVQPMRRLALVFGRRRALFGLFGHRDGASSTMVGGRFHFRVRNILPIKTAKANRHVFVD